MRGRDVEEDELVGAGGVVALRQLYRVACVAQVDEAGPLDDTATVDVEARDDALGVHRAQPDAGSAACSPSAFLRFGLRSASSLSAARASATPKRRS